ncbi:MAG TPA: Hpt domain-containing protein [Bryobacteraceae bacterium]|nr:Hpt domain-containing protein [Bryobacteraceae bacterium]
MVHTLNHHKAHNVEIAVLGLEAASDQDIINEFLIESNDNLTRLEQEIVELEKSPWDPALLASIFRTIHTIKGTCGFLAFTALESVARDAISAHS